MGVREAMRIKYVKKLLSFFFAKFFFAKRDQSHEKNVSFYGNWFNWVCRSP